MGTSLHTCPNYAYSMHGDKYSYLFPHSISSGSFARWDSEFAVSECKALINDHEAPSMLG